MSTREDAMIINSLVRQALTSAQEVMGDNGLNAVLRTSGLERFIGKLPPNNLEPSIQASQYAQLNQAIEDFYGRAGKGMLRRIGKASFQYAVREQAALLGVAGVALKLLPEKQRIKFILNGMVDALKKSNPQVDARRGIEPVKILLVGAGDALRREVLRKGLLAEIEQLVGGRYLVDTAEGIGGRRKVLRPIDRVDTAATTAYQDNGQQERCCGIQESHGATPCAHYRGIIGG